MAPGFDINVHLRSLNQRGIDCDSYCERIIHRSAGRAEFRRKTDQVFCNSVDEIIDLAMRASKLVKILLGQQGLVRNIETNHGQWPPGLKHDLSSFGIVVDVGFSRGIHVPAGNTAAHEDDFLHQRNNLWVLLDRDRTVSQWTNGNKGEDRKSVV